MAKKKVENVHFIKIGFKPMFFVSAPIFWHLKTGTNKPLFQKYNLPKIPSD